MSEKRSFIDITTDIVMAKDDFSLTDQEIKEKLAGLYTELARKEDGVYWFYKKLDKDIELAKEYRQKIDNEIKKRQTAQKNLKELVIEANTTVDKLPKYSDFNPIKILESASVNVIDESIIPQEYWVEHRAVKLDKKNLLIDLKKGKKIDGVELKKNPYVKGLK
tara:strand:+ start:1293 stop:1784 length:492 start_codon:yes stop_codon:yes gene_type:complete